MHQVYYWVGFVVVWANAGVCLLATGLWLSRYLDQRYDDTPPGRRLD